MFNVAYQWGPIKPPTQRLALGPAMRVSVYPALAVLVVACPCALILATPAAVIAALGRLAGTGILVKGGAALERLASVKAFAFDKTGTLTEGHLELGDSIPLGVNETELLRLAASAEQCSEHPLGTLIVAAASAEKMCNSPVSRHFKPIPAGESRPQLEAAKIVIGTRRFLEEQAVSISAELDAFTREFGRGRADRRPGRTRQSTDRSHWRDGSDSA